MTIETALAFALALLVWALIPGPAVLATIGRSLTAGLGSSIKLITGILLGDLFYLSLVLFGMSALGKVLGDLFVVVRILGAIYLIFLGVKLWVKEPEFNNGALADQEPDRYKTLLTGFSITLGNPKAILFHMGFLPTFFDLSTISLLDAFFIALIFLAVLGGCLVTCAYAASRAGGLFRDKRKIRILNRRAGTLLIGAGIAAVTKK